MHNPSKLVVLDRAFALAVALHRSPVQRTGKVAPGLSNQLLRAVSSIAANIAEGARCDTEKCFVHYLEIAIGSANETEQHLRLACAIGIFGDKGEAHLAEVIEIRRMIYGLRRYLLSKVPQPAPKPPRANLKSHI